MPINRVSTPFQEERPSTFKKTFNMKFLKKIEMQKFMICFYATLMIILICIYDTYTLDLGIITFDIYESIVVFELVILSIAILAYFGVNNDSSLALLPLLVFQTLLFIFIPIVFDVPAITKTVGTFSQMIDNGSLKEDIVWFFSLALLLICLKLAIFFAQFYSMYSTFSVIRSFRAIQRKIRDEPRGIPFSLDDYSEVELQDSKEGSRSIWETILNNIIPKKNVSTGGKSDRQVKFDLQPVFNNSKIYKPYA